MSVARSHPKQSTRIGDLLLAGGFVRTKQLQDALHLSKRIHQPLCQILQSQQRLSSCEKRSLLSLQTKLRLAIDHAETPKLNELGCRLGDLLVACGNITPADLNKALAEQPNQARPLGSILLKKGLISLQKLRECLQLQQKLMSAAAAVLLALTGTSASYADDPFVNDPSWGQLQPNFTTQAPHALRDSWRKPGFTRAVQNFPHSAADEIMRSKNGKMVLRLTETGMEFRAFF